MLIHGCGPGSKAFFPQDPVNCPECQGALQTTAPHTAAEPCVVAMPLAGALCRGSLQLAGAACKHPCVPTLLTFTRSFPCGAGFPEYLAQTKQALARGYHVLALQAGAGVLAGCIELCCAAALLLLQLRPGAAARFHRCNRGLAAVISLLAQRVPRALCAHLAVAQRCSPCAASCVWCAGQQRGQRLLELHNQQRQPGRPHHGAPSWMLLLAFSTQRCKLPGFHRKA